MNKVGESYTHIVNTVILIIVLKSGITILFVGVLECIMFIYCVWRGSTTTGVYICI
jgi:hypothetical protein